MAMTLGNPILQLGSSRFLQAHVDLFVSDALEEVRALGRITVVQNTTTPKSSARTAALTSSAGDPVRILGLSDGQAIDTIRRCRSILAALHVDRHCTALREEVSGGAVRVMVSNNGFAGWRLDLSDTRRLLEKDAPPPRSFPARLLVLLHGRWQALPTSDMSVLPCKLVNRNGEILRDLVVTFALRWGLPEPFTAWLQNRVVWANTIVDRIVFDSMGSVGALAEPFARWAIERSAGLVLPCEHPAIVVTDDLAPFDHHKRFLLHLAQAFLAELWLASESRDPELTIFAAMNDRYMRSSLEAVWSDEVLPVLEALGTLASAMADLVNLRERLLNPHLSQAFIDIAQNNAQRKMQHVAPLVKLAESWMPELPQRRLRTMLGLARAAVVERL